MKPPVGVAGLGRLGGAVARRLLSQGHPVVVYNRSADRARELERLGARVAADPAALCAQTSTVVSVLLDEAAVQQACDAGLLAGLRGGTHLCMGTLAPSAADRLAVQHRQSGVRFVATPVQGRPQQAEAGRLAAWVSGDPLPEPARAVLMSLSSRLIELGGQARQACAAKLAVNLLMFANLELFAEALAFVEASGVDTGLFGQGLVETAFAAPLFAGIVQALRRHDDTAQGSDLAVALKDLLLLMRETGEQRMPVASRVAAVYARAAAQGLAAQDPAAVRHALGPGS